jgi:sialate O-acetylesterase
MRIPTVLLAAAPLLAQAELKLPAIFTDHLVLQQKPVNPVWGWDTPGAAITVTYAGKSYSATAAKDGRWEVKLDAQPASATPASIAVKGSTEKTIQDVLVGEVWLCSGQSNMGFNLAACLDSDLELLGCSDPLLRLVSVPNVGTQELQNDFVGAWAKCDATSAKDFTAVGYHFGKKLREVLGVPVGLIDNAWGGSSAEAWVRRDVLEKDAKFTALMEKWTKTEAEFTQAKFDEQMAAHKAKAAAWLKRAQAARKAKQPEPKGKPGKAPRNPMTGQHRPGNLYAGCLKPLIGYGIKGAVWYQGESNAGDAALYSYLFPLMITHWRSEWQQGDFPFYWVQLADYKTEAVEPEAESWGEVREAQTLTLKLPNTGQAVTIDLGEGKDIHPRNKRDVAERLARWALVKDYGMKLSYRSAELKKAEFYGAKAIVALDTFGAGKLETFDVKEVLGLQACGTDNVWHWAKGQLKWDTSIEVTCPGVKDIKAVRYAWSNNPVCNLYTAGHSLPVTPFRTDSFPAPASAAK